MNGRAGKATACVSGTNARATQATHPHASLGIRSAVWWAYTASSGTTSETRILPGWHILCMKGVAGQSNQGRGARAGLCPPTCGTRKGLGMCCARKDLLVQVGAGRCEYEAAERARAGATRGLRQLAAARAGVRPGRREVGSLPGCRGQRRYAPHPCSLCWRGAPGPAPRLVTFELRYV